MRHLFTLILLFTTTSLSGQDLAQLQTDFSSMQYENVIRSSQELLIKKENFSADTLIEIYRLNAIANYALNHMEAAALSFSELLRLNPQYQMDPIRNSPKIISFFDQLKKDFKPAVQKPETKTKTDTVFLPGKSIDPPQYSFQGTMLRSIVLPGWGHYYQEQKTSGLILGAAALATAGPMIYFIFETDNRERDYLNEIDKSQIQSKYDSYNQAYLLRNIFIAAYASVWIYTQIDITSGTLWGTNSDVHTSIQPALLNRHAVGISLSHSF